MKNLFLKNRLYFPAITIVAVVASLLVVIGISTFRNIDREEKTQLNFVYKQGLTMLRAIEAGARSGMAMPMWGGDAIARLLQETGKDESIAYIYLVDENGIVSHHSVPSLEGQKAMWQPMVNDESDVVSQIRQIPGGAQVYDIAKRFSPEVGDLPPMMDHHTSQAHLHENTVIVIGLNMHDFSEARKADIQHAIVMAAIVLALGLGTFFFIFVIQNYYLVDKTLRYTQDYTRQVIENMANGLLGLNKDGRLISYNDVALNLLELDRNDLENLDIQNIIDFKATGIQNTLENCQVVMDYEFIFHTKSGGTIPLSISSTPIENEPGVCDGVVIVIRDLREIKELENKVREAEKLAAIGKLAASVAHEVRNPLSSIKGFAQHLYNNMEKGSRQKQYAHIMIKEVDRINRVINDLLTFSRPIQLDLKPSSVSDLVSHAVGLVEGDAETRNVTVNVHTEHAMPQVVLDEGQMTQVILNLLLNAMSAVEKNGFIDVRLKINHEAEQTVIEIQDDGDGISSELMPKIFDPFVTTRETGTGLGLSIVKKIVDNHGGTIDVKSPPPDCDEGSIFTITLPTKFKL